MVSIIIPLYNGQNTILKTLESLVKQSDFFSELIVVNDNSSDNSAGLVEDFLIQKSVAYKIINHQTNKGLAASYNTGIKAAQGEIMVLVHQDVELYDKALKNLIAPFEDEKVIGVYHYTFQPFEVWQKYNFWQKYFFCRWVGKKIYGLNGKFDAFRKSALAEIGLFDAKNFHSAGEDGDILIRLKNRGKIVKSQAGILHLHDERPDFSIFDIIKKQAQLSEAQGALYRKHGLFDDWLGFLKAFFREILLIGTFLPVVNFFAWPLIIFYCFFASRAMFVYEYKDWRTYFLPLVNLGLFWISFIFSIKGYVRGKQNYH